MRMGRRESPVGTIPRMRPLWCNGGRGCRWICRSFGHDVKSTASVRRACGCGLIKIFVQETVFVSTGLLTCSHLLEDGIAYVVERGVALNDPGGSRSLAVVEKREEVRSD